MVTEAGVFVPTKFKRICHDLYLYHFGLFSVLFIFSESFILLKEVGLIVPEVRRFFKKPNQEIKKCWV